MKGVFKLWIFFTLSGAIAAKAQDARSLIKEGTQLHNAHNYAGAIEKYKAALKLEPDNSSANYQLGFTLNASGKGSDALPYLQKAVDSDVSALIAAAVYNLMGSIYDHSAQPQMAIDSYRLGIQADSASHALHYNLGLAYFRNRQYAEAEKSARDALKIEPKHPGSIRLYALVSFHQDKRAAAFLSFCRFLWLAPNNAKSAEAYGNIQHILKGGTLKAEPGKKAVLSVDSDTKNLNQAITMAVRAVPKVDYPLAADLFSAQLKMIFKEIGQLAEKQNGNDLWFTNLAQYYYKLSQTNHVEVFARVISQRVDKQAAKWLNDHPQQKIDLEEWAGEE